MMDPVRRLHRRLRPLFAATARCVGWWIEEMREMLLPHRDGAAASSSRLIARRDGDGYHVGRYKDGQWQNVAPEDGIRAVLCLPRSAGLIRPLRLPLVPPADVRRMIALDIDRLTPFAADQVLIDTRILSRDDSGQIVAVGVVRQEDATTALHHAGTRGIRPSALAMEDEEGTACFDFLPMLQNPAPPDRRWNPARLWGLAAALAGVNLAVATWSDVAALDDLRNRAESRRPLAESAVKLRDAVTAETARRMAARERHRQSDPLPLLDSLTATLPDSVWVQRLDWDGVTLRLGGWSRDPDDTALLARIEADPFLADARIEPSSRPLRPPHRPVEIVAVRDRETPR